MRKTYMHIYYLYICITHCICIYTCVCICVMYDAYHRIPHTHTPHTPHTAYPRQPAPHIHIVREIAKGRCHASMSLSLCLCLCLCECLSLCVLRWLLASSCAGEWAWNMAALLPPFPPPRYQDPLLMLPVESDDAWLGSYRSVALRKKNCFR